MYLSLCPVTPLSHSATLVDSAQLINVQRVFLGRAGRQAVPNFVPHLHHKA